MDLRQTGADTQQFQEVVGDAVDVPGPQHHDKITGLHRVGQHIRHPTPLCDVAHIQMSPPLQGVVQRFAGHAVDAFFPGGVDLGEEKHVGVVEGIEEFVE